MNPRLAALRAYGILLTVALAVVVLDQAAKALVERELKGRSPVPVLGGAFQLDYTRNTGAAFSIFRNGGWLFAVVAVVVILGILLYYPRLRTRGFLLTAAPGLVLGGAMGNLVDRIRLGYVIDFIDFGWFPVFNVADSAIVCGVTLLILASLLNPERSEP